MNKTKNGYCLLFWEKHGLDEKGKRYLKEKHTFPFALICHSIYTKYEKECATIYDIDDEGQKIALSKIYLEEGDEISVWSESF